MESIQVSDSSLHDIRFWLFPQTPKYSLNLDTFHLEIFSSSPLIFILQPFSQPGSYIREEYRRVVLFSQGRWQPHLNYLMTAGFSYSYLFSFVSLSLTRLQPTFSLSSSLWGHYMLCVHAFFFQIFIHLSIAIHVPFALCPFLSSVPTLSAKAAF